MSFRKKSQAAPPIILRTPDEDERSELQHWYLYAELLIISAYHKTISRKEYVRCAELLDSIPSVGEYFRHRLATSEMFEWRREN